MVDGRAMATYRPCLPWADGPSGLVNALQRLCKRLGYLNCRLWVRKEGHDTMMV
jgi:hypothetical protein